MKKLKRSPEDKVIAGVFGGMGEYFQIDPVLLRLVGILLFLLSGFIPFLIVYIIAVIIIPKKDFDPQTDTPVYKKWWFWLIILMSFIILISPLLIIFSLMNHTDRSEVFLWDRSEGINEHQKTENTITERKPPAPDKIAVLKYLENNIISENNNGEIFAEYYEFGRNKEHLFIWAYIAEYYHKDGEIRIGTAASLPLVLSLSGDSVEGHRQPQDGSHYSSDVKEMFPSRYHDEVLNFQSVHRETLNDLKEIAEERADSVL
ncbi:MAG: PspC domain-containing protein [Candidatus Paceibacterota bacterium]